MELLLRSEQSGLGGAVRDYAVWDDAYEYVSQPNRKFESDNFAQQSLNVVQLDFVAIMSAPDHLLFSSEKNPVIKDPLSTPPLHSGSLRTLLTQLPEWQSGHDASKPTTYMTVVDGRPLILAVSGIYDVLQEKPQHGLMIFGRYLDGEYLDHLQQQAEIRLQLSIDLPKKHDDSVIGLSIQSAEKKLNGWAVPQIWLQVSKEIYWQPRIMVMGIFTLGLLIVLLIASFVLQQMLNKLVVNRIETFADLAWRRSRGERVYWPVEGNNELDLLARTFNELMDELHAAQKNMHDLSITDALTALGNRRGMEEQVEHMMKTCQLGMSLTMLLMDLDGFKLINDSLGHAAGDLLLQEVAQRMRQVMRRQDKLFRMGGDEFAVLMPNTTVEQGELLAERLVEIINEPMNFGQHKLSVSGSVGVAEWDGTLDGLELIRHADLAMYTAKRSGKSRVCVEQELRQAIMEHCIDPHFQPVIDTDTGKVIAVEMLARWQRDGELMSTLGFIRLAEDLGLIGQLSMQLLDKGLISLSHFRQQQPDLKLQINISPLQFADRNLAAVILQVVAEHGLPSNALSIEVTEGAMLLYPEQVEQTMRQFVDAGVSMHLDDFGTGYSSLARLRDLPFDTVKLDRSFIVMTAEGDNTLSQAIFDMATSMHMDIIAEGVENQREYDELHAIGYRRMQGFMFAHPMPEDALIQWLDGQRKPSSEP